MFLIDIRELCKGLDVQPLRHDVQPLTPTPSSSTTWRFPPTSLIGQEGKGFSYILDGMNAERILIASESLGDGRWFIEKAVAVREPAGDLR